MSHTVGQTTEDNQKSLTSQDSLIPEDKANPNSLLSDADYEFLFNQLLEGVAHGWHDRRIIKFFSQLGDRGNQPDWIAWLERLRPKIVTLPIESKRQIGTIMIRLGELTQSSSQVSEIGVVSNRIGRELLFGNVGDVVWEYVGPDLIVDSISGKSETESAFSQRLPEDFTELAEAAADTTESLLQDKPVDIDNAPFESAPESVELNDSSAEQEEELPLIDLDFLENFPADTSAAESTITDGSNTVNDATESSDELDTDLTASKTSQLPEYTETPSSTFDNEFEFELSEKDSVEAIPTPEENISKPESSSEPVELNDDFTTNVSLEFDERTREFEPDLSQSQSDLNSNVDPVAIDPQQVINLINEDEQLAREISQKLNVRPNTSSIEKALDNSSASSVSISDSVDVDRSNIELIEGWFNLGLKQVSGGEFDKAIVSWEKALSINPNLSEAWHNRGSALGRLGRYQEAIESFQKALSIDPNNYQAWNDRAHALYQLENWAAAADSWGNAIKITPANHLFWYNRGCALEQLESWAESISSYEKALEIKPDFQPARSRYTNLIADNSRQN